MSPRHDRDDIFPSSSTASQDRCLGQSSIPSVKFTVKLPRCCTGRSVNRIPYGVSYGSRSRSRLRVEDQGEIQRCIFVQVMGAITREKKEAIVDTIKGKLKDSAMVFSMSITGLTVGQLEQLRRTIPREHASVYVCKNTLMKVAIADMDEWSSLRSISKKENAWVFVGEEGIADTMKTYFNFNKEITRIRRANAEDDEVVTSATVIYGGTVIGRACTPQEIADLKDLPTKAEAMGSLLGTLNAVPAAFLSTLNQPALQLAMQTTKIADLDADKTKTAGEFVQ